MATSGTIATTTFTTRQVVDHAFRRCKLTPQQITTEYLQTAQDLLWMILQQLNERGIMMHLVEQQLLGLTDSVLNLPTNAGSLNVYSANLRTITRLTGTASASTGAADFAFDGDLTTSWAPGVTGANLDLLLTSSAPVTSAGIYPTTSGTWSFQLQTSSDGVTWTTAQTITNKSVTAGTWLWYDISGVSSATYLRLLETGTTVMSVGEMVWGNNQSDIPMSPLDRDTYDMLPNKAQTGRPVQYWFNRQKDTSYLTLYPSPSSDYTLTSLVVARVQRQFMDVGTLAQTLELPNRWYLAVVAVLASHLGDEIKEVDADLGMKLDAKADKIMQDAWDGEEDGAPVRLMPNLYVYRA